MFNITERAKPFCFAVKIRVYKEKQNKTRKFFCFTQFKDLYFFKLVKYLVISYSDIRFIFTSAIKKNKKKNLFIEFREEATHMCSKRHRATMQLSIFLIMIGMSVVVDGDAPKGLHFVGVGYNLLEGNPEGGDVTNGGVDPGLLFTRKIFKLTWNTNKKSMDNRFSVPDQVTFAPRSSCVTTNKKEVFSGSKSYQEKLNADVQVSGKRKKRV